MSPQALSDVPQIVITELKRNLATSYSNLQSVFSLNKETVEKLIALHLWKRSTALIATKSDSLQNN